MDLTLFPWPDTTEALAIWSNQNMPIAWATKDKKSKVYNYGAEELIPEGPSVGYGGFCDSPWCRQEVEDGDPNIVEVDYKPGKHAKKLAMLEGTEDMGAYFQKRGRFWYLVGYVCYAHVRFSEQLDGKGSIHLQIDGRGCWTNPDMDDIPGIRLATNKRDSLAMLGWQKKMGKGTGNLNQGVCRIEKFPVTKK